MSGLIDLPTSWELNPFNLYDPTSQDITLSSRTEKNFASTIPSDVSLADDFLHQEQLIKSFQMFFSKAQPIIGKLYSGPIDGIVNPDLTKAAKNTESIISKKINNTEIIGSLWNDNKKTFNTTTNDLSSALQIISQHT